MILEQGDVLANALHPFADKFFLAGRNAGHHVLYIGVVEHSAMNDASPRNMIECVARHLFIANENVVASTRMGIYPHGLKHVYHALDVLAEYHVHLVVVCDAGEQNAALVNVDTATSAFSSDEVDAFFLTILGIYFIVDELVTSKHHRWRHLPHEETILRTVDMSCDIFFHRQVEAGESVRF